MIVSGLRFSILVAALLFPASKAACGDQVVGRASVVDGDTLEIFGKRIRLHGVDAPESWQLCGTDGGDSYRCGKAAAIALDEFLAASRPTRCELIERDRYQRSVAVCFRADGVEVNRWLVESGNAVDWNRYSKGAYAGSQTKAQERAVGIWRGAFQLPCEARAERTRQKSAC